MIIGKWLTVIRVENDSYLHKWGPPCLLFMLASLYLFHFSLIHRYAVDIPIIDEWEMLTPDGLTKGFSADWLLAFHNEHRIMPTKLLIWLQLHYDGWNIATQQMINFIIFGLLITVLILLNRQISPPHDRFLLYPCFILFLLSPINFNNHMWGFQSSFHLVILFVMLSAVCAFRERVTPVSLALFTLGSIAAMNSLSLGVVCSSLLWGIFLLYLVAGKKSPALSRAAKGSLIVMGSVFVAAVTNWFISYSKQGAHPPVANPLTPQFWNFFLNLLSNGAGIDTESMFLGGVCLLAIIFPVIGIFYKQGRNACAGEWLLAALVACILSSLAVISAGRACLGVGYAKSAIRYVEFSFLLIPLTALSWWVFLRETAKIRAVVLTILWICCMYGYRDKWSFGKYRSAWETKSEMFKCLESYNPENPVCKFIDTIPEYADKLARAKALELSFTRNLANTL